LGYPANEHTSITFRVCESKRSRKISEMECLLTTCVNGTILNETELAMASGHGPRPKERGSDGFFDFSIGNPA
jgi:hypothetical protein